ncbi:hypothetical protein Bca52824_001279 [Brassica carinata]|uniref:Uncharacterized protein n=1 Tax=Brassica carinata TaxID=52824 RepID=A0A8X8B9M4_BRACI|nr:hypothetical protein Bca52824_001279 [Brassica carinata]
MVNDASTGGEDGEGLVGASEAVTPLDDQPAVKRRAARPERGRPPARGSTSPSRPDLERPDWSKVTNPLVLASPRPSKQEQERPGQSDLAYPLA